jgi:hypothetical protein
VARIILLDSGPLWLACYAPGQNPLVDQCLAWLHALETAGAVFVIPAIADYETRRVLLRRRAHIKLGRLDALVARYSYLEITAAALHHAAAFWAHVRQRGQPTAQDLKLDTDCIVAGQSRTIGGPGDTVTIATNNVKHFSRFPGIHAQDWPTIS